VAISCCLILFPLILHYIQTLEAGVQQDLDFCKSRARDMWREMFEVRTNGRSEAASRLANMVMQRRQLEKRDTIADFWAHRLNDMQLRDDPVVEKQTRAANAAGQHQGQVGGQPPAEKPKPKRAEAKGHVRAVCKNANDYSSS
jgi:hypothetical protein